MEVLFNVFWFVLGSCLGSFYHVVGYRIPKGQSLIHPKRSYCPDCHHELCTKDLIPIISFLLSGGKCRYCKKKISCFYPVLEFITGLLFMVSFHLFGFTYEFLVALVLSSLLSIILVSDITYLIIPDSVLVVASILLIVFSLVFQGEFVTIQKMMSGILMFGVMYLVMLVGNFVFQKECLGGADIKLMFIAGFVLDPFMSLCVIFVSSVIALPVALILNIVSQEKMIPYGPFIMLAILMFQFSGLNFDKIVEIYQRIL